MQAATHALYGAKRERTARGEAAPRDGWFSRQEVIAAVTAALKHTRR